jgi:hypothetical protein
MKKVIFIVLVSLMLTASIGFTQQKEIPQVTLQKIDKCLQDNGEIYFKFKVFMKSELETLTRIISIANVDGFDVYAYANKKEFENFLKLGYEFEILPHSSEVSDNIQMAENIDKILATWDKYPTYEQYIAMMTDFANNNPSLCRLVDAGTTPGGRKILFAVISDNVTVREPEPRFMYTSTMHGNETAGYVFMLRLIDTLLSSYNANNATFCNLINNMEIWINPLANPDGTYKGGNNTVTKAIRGNSNNVDLNRNFPDAIMGPNPDGNPTQPETQIFMNIASEYYFTMSANFHSGVEVVNYPWDHQLTPLTADNNWWVMVSRQYADLAHKINKNYMKFMDNGITLGAAWYIIYGGRQDYMNYFKNGRECTVELNGGSYILAENKLNLYWKYNFSSLIAYMNQALFGLTGTVSDNKGPLQGVKISLATDKDNSEVYTDESGKYYRLLFGGKYNVTFSADGYKPLTVNNVTVKNNEAKVLNVTLSKSNDKPLFSIFERDGIQNGVPAKYDLSQNYPNPFNPVTKMNFDIPENGLISLKVYDILGKEVATLVNEVRDAGYYTVTFNASKLSSGVYFYRLSANGFSSVKRMAVIK